MDVGERLVTLRLKSSLHPVKASRCRMYGPNADAPMDDIPTSREDLHGLLDEVIDHGVKGSAEITARFLQGLLGRLGPDGTAWLFKAGQLTEAVGNFLRQGYDLMNSQPIDIEAKDVTE